MTVMMMVARVADRHDAREHNTGQRGLGERPACGLDPSLTKTRATLFIVADTQNVTLSLPRDVLKRAKRLAADRETSVSALMARR